MEADDHFLLAEALQLLRFAEVAEGDVKITPYAWRQVESSLDACKRLFADHVRAFDPLAGLIRRVLDERASHRAPLRHFSEELEDHVSEERAKETARAVISWRRRAELFAMTRI